MKMREPNLLKLIFSGCNFFKQKPFPFKTFADVQTLLRVNSLSTADAVEQ